MQLLWPDFNASLPNDRQRAESYFLGRLIEMRPTDAQQRYFEEAQHLGVSERVFSRPTFRKIWRVVEHAYLVGMPVDCESLFTLLSKDEISKEPLGFEIGAIATEAPPTQCASFLLKDMLSEIAKDEVDRRALELMKLVRGRNLTPEQVAKEANEAFGALLVDGMKDGMRRTLDASEIAQDALDHQLAIEDGEVDLKEGFVTTGLPELDSMLGSGFRKKGFYIIGARPGVGKTMCSLQMAVRAAQAGKRVIYFSMEMDAKDLGNRILSRLSGVDSKRIVTGIMTAEEKSRYFEACEIMRDLPLQINDSAMPDLNKIFRAVAATMATREIDMIVIDYLQQLELRGETKWFSRQAELTTVTSRIKKFSGDKNLIVLGCAQINRDVEKLVKHGKVVIPSKADLKDCGSLEQDADGILLMHRPSMLHDHQDDQDYLVIAKNRGGEEGMIPISVDAKIGRVSVARRFSK